MLVLSSDGQGQGTLGRGTLGQGQLGQGQLGQATLGRVAALASLGLCFLNGAAEPAAAAPHRHHAESGASKPEAPKPPTGPLILVVSIGGQHVTVYDNGTPIASSQVSTGMAGHPTPMGVFSVIQKQRWHHSNLYSNAPMPFMQRITWSGVAMHAGVVPGHPASHGCIRLPERFAVRLWGMTKVGARVIVSRGDIVPYQIDHPRLAGLVKAPETPNAEAKTEGTDISSRAVIVAATGAVTADDSARNLHGDAEHAVPETESPASPRLASNQDRPAEAGNGGEPATAAPPESPKAEPSPASKIDEALRHPGQLSLFVSRREGKLFVRKGFTPVFDTPVTIAHPEIPLGTHVFTASRPANDGAGVRWLAMSISSDRAAAGAAHGKHKGRAAERPAPVTAATPRQSAAEALDRIELPQEALDRIAPLVTPGTSFMISDQGLGGETGKDTDFIVVTK